MSTTYSARFLAAAIALAMGCGAHQHPSPLDMDEQQLSALRSWPAVASAPAAAPQPGVAPTLPTFPPLIPGNNTRLVERLEVLVRGHPDADTRDALTTALDVGNVRVQLAPLGQRAAVFGNVVSASGSQAVLAVDPRVLSQDFAADPKFTMHLWLLLTHELQHYRQWQATTGRERATFDIHSDGSVKASTRQDCRWLWAHELEAYTAECAPAAAWGRPDLAETALCENPADSLPRNQRMLEVMLKSNGRNDPCASTWAALAGHPHPEAFGVLRPDADT